MLLIPIVSYGYARAVLDFEISVLPGKVEWSDHELSTFLTHVAVSLLAYMIVWIACALQYWIFLASMALSTPISLLWYVRRKCTNK